jgi:hypothetical protein
VYGTDELGNRLRAAVREATSADTALWEHSTRGKTVWSMERPDLLSDAAAADSELRGMHEEVERVLARLSPAERKVADCYAADNLTWQQAALHTGQRPAMGVRVRRKLRFGQEAGATSAWHPVIVTADTTRDSEQLMPTTVRTWLTE